MSKKESILMEKIIASLLKELDLAEKEHEWPGDVIHQIAIIVEEVGELMQAALDYAYSSSAGYNKKKSLKRNMEKEAIQVGAMAIRFLKNFQLIGKVNET